jgi:AcrR family transcriptional regulator
MAKPEMGLRARQRLRRKKRILEVAGRLFTDKGFDETTLEEIARRAELSVPTIYGYFGSKSELLLGLLEIDIEILRPRIEKILANASRATRLDALRAIVSLVLVETTEGYDVAQKRMWREISAAAFRAPGKQRQAFLKLQNTQAEALQQLLEILRQRGELRRDLDCASAAQAIHAIARNGFRLYLVDEGVTLTDLAARMRRQLSVILEGMRPG